MKKISIFVAGSISEVLANYYGVSRYFWYTVGIATSLSLIYKKTKETKPIRFARMKKKLLVLWVDHFFWSPQFFLLLFIVTSPFALVDRNNKHIFSFMDEVDTWWMTTIMVISTIVWLPTFFALCISIGFYDEQKEESVYNQRRLDILKWYTSKNK
jgi:hypothetical protein